MLGFRFVCFVLFCLLGTAGVGKGGKGGKTVILPVGERECVC